MDEWHVFFFFSKVITNMGRNTWRVHLSQSQSVSANFSVMDRQRLNETKAFKRSSIVVIMLDL